MDLKETITQNLMQLWILMGQHMRHAHQARTETSQHLDPSRGKGRIIAMLNIKDGLKTKDLAHVLGIRVSSLNETLAKMEQEGLIERMPSEQDKRIMLVFLTDKGRTINVDEPEQPDILDGFSEEELEELSGYISRMLSNAEQSLDEEFVELFKEQWQARMQFETLGGNTERRRPPFPRPSARGTGPLPFNTRRNMRR